jgi:hypothetical protein
LKPPALCRAEPTPSLEACVASGQDAVELGQEREEEREKENEKKGRAAEAKRRR